MFQVVVECRVGVLPLVCYRCVWEVTALSASRAAKLGGTHLHRLFSFVASGRRWVCATSLAAKAVRRLGGMPVKQRFLQDVRVIVIDEMAQASPMLSIIQNILYYVLTA